MTTEKTIETVLADNSFFWKNMLRRRAMSEVVEIYRDKCEISRDRARVVLADWKSELDNEVIPVPEPIENLQNEQEPSEQTKKVPKSRYTWSLGCVVETKDGRIVEITKLLASGGFVGLVDEQVVMYESDGEPSQGADAGLSVAHDTIREINPVQKFEDKVNLDLVTNERLEVTAEELDLIKEFLTKLRENTKNNKENNNE